MYRPYSIITRHQSLLMGNQLVWDYGIQQDKRITSESFRCWCCVVPYRSGPRTFKGTVRVKESRGRKRYSFREGTGLVRSVERIAGIVPCSKIGWKEEGEI
jgi:hypothetical protein